MCIRDRIIRSGLSRANTRNKPAVLLNILRYIYRIERNLRIEIGEEDNQHGINQCI